MPGRPSRRTRPSRNRSVDTIVRCDEETESVEETESRSKGGDLSVAEIFQGLTPEEIEEIEHATVMRACKAGGVFFTPGETSQMLYILKKGIVQIYRESAWGRRLVIAELHPYSFFGEMSCIGQGVYDRFARAKKDSLVCTMNRADVEQLLLSKPKVALRILEVIGKRMIEAERGLEEFAFKEAASRIASFLLKAADSDEVRELRHQDIADRLGVFRETVTETLDELKDSGIITIGRMQIKIIDRKGLEQKAAE